MTRVTDYKARLEHSLNPSVAKALASAGVQTLAPANFKA
jgi:hypothetical protein